ncbi:hypothetical protein FB451DRAFT_1565361 [Mycena latifolia]|nr:hypothetical protein FB451DRAFT_1565361 [Mycena latifolia]
MLSKILGFGLGALTLVHVHAAASVQAPMVSCKVDIGMAIDTPEFNMLDDLKPGIYRIRNNATVTWLRGDGMKLPSSSRISLNMIFAWKVDHADNEYEFKMLNVALNSSTFINSEGEVATDILDGRSDSFAIVSGYAEDTFIAVQSADPSPGLT